MNAFRVIWNNRFGKNLPTRFLRRFLQCRPAQVLVLAGAGPVRNCDDSNYDLHFFVAAALCERRISPSKSDDSHRPPLQILLCLFDQMDIENAHLFIHGFAHVVDREQRDGYAGKRFHLDTGLRNSPGGAFHLRVIV